MNKHRAQAKSTNTHGGESMADRTVRVDKDPINDETQAEKLLTTWAMLGAMARENRMANETRETKGKPND